MDKKRNTIIVVGDSMAMGAWDKEGGWVARLKKFLDNKNVSEPEKYYYPLYNLSISGETTTNSLANLKKEIEKRSMETKEVTIIIALGANDSAYIKSKGGQNTPEKTFARNIEQIIKISRKFSSKIIFIGLTPIIENMTNPLPWDSDFFHNNQNAKKYNDIIKSICKKENVFFIDIFEKFFRSNYKKLLMDGVHPNEKGHELIFKLVREFLIKNRIIVF